MPQPSPIPLLPSLESCFQEIGWPQLSQQNSAGDANGTGLPMDPGGRLQKTPPCGRRSISLRAWGETCSLQHILAQNVKAF